MEDQNIMHIHIDGACAGNPGPGGWGVLLQYRGITKEVFGYELQTTNNRMEIQAAIEALKILKKPHNLNIYTDSRYVQLGITKWVHSWCNNNWKTSNNKPVKNVDLWQQLCLELKKHERVSWYWVKGHSGDIGNEKADMLANKGKEEAMRVLKCQC